MHVQVGGQNEPDAEAQVANVQYSAPEDPVQGTAGMAGGGRGGDGRRPGGERAGSRPPEAPDRTRTPADSPVVKSRVGQDRRATRPARAAAARSSSSATA